jgi:hypothetical protein
MYDSSLDVNASLYGTKKGCEPLHPQYNIVSKKVELVNTALNKHDVTVKARVYDTSGKIIWEHEAAASISPNSVVRLFDVPTPAQVEGVYFLKLTLLESGKEQADNIYWLTTKEKDYATLAGLPKALPDVQIAFSKQNQTYTGTVRLAANDKISFFNRIKVFDKKSGKRILPVHYSDNYVTLMPGDKREIGVEFISTLPKGQIEIVIDSWTADRLTLPVK